MQIDSKEQNILMSNIVRKVEAETKELAIGKFVVATQEIKANQKLNIAEKQDFIIYPSSDKTPNYLDLIANKIAEYEK